MTCSQKEQFDFFSPIILVIFWQFFFSKIALFGRECSFSERIAHFGSGLLFFAFSLRRWERRTLFLLFCSRGGSNQRVIALLASEVGATRSLLLFSKERIAFFALLLFSKKQNSESPTQVCTHLRSNRAIWEWFAPSSVVKEQSGSLFNPPR